MVTLALALVLAQEPVITGDRSVASKCEVSDDAEYGYTKGKPIKVGGTPVYGAARQRRYLQALVGPAGQPITFKRRGSLPADDTRTRDTIILDLYEVTYAGLEKPIELYLDWYRWEPPKAPRGLLCGSAFALGDPPKVEWPPRPGNTAPAPPPVDRKAQWQQLVALAMRTSAEGEVPAIPLAADGSTRHGVIIDAFRFVAGAARSLASTGRPVSAEMIAGMINEGQHLVIAHALSCDGETRTPMNIEMIGPQQNQPLSAKSLINAGELRTLLPWSAVPEGAVGATFPGNIPPPGGAVRLTYDGAACPDTATSVTLPLKAGAPQKIVDVLPVWPAGIPFPPAGESVNVEIRATIDVEGVPVSLSVFSGPADFHGSALAAVEQWRYKPITINGASAYVPVTMRVVVTFSSKTP